jgi:AraC-like DNA-binding protein
MVTFQVFDAHPSLADFVQNIFVIDALLDPKDTSLVGHYPPTPQNCIFLYINHSLKAKKFNEEFFSERPRAVVVGPQVTRMHLKVNRHHKVAVIGFLPGGLFRLLGIPMDKLYDEGFDAFDLMGPEITELLDRCEEATSLGEINREITKYLLGKLPTIKELIPLDKALNRLLVCQGKIPITQVAEEACLSIRQFERKCKERLGFSPKVYARIIRFSLAYRLFEKSTPPNWSDIAYQAGYYDQMHFIKDFKEFAGLTPTLMEEEVRKAPFKFQEPIRI